ADAIHEVWSTDGTAAGTVRLNSHPDVAACPSPIARLGGVVFAANGGIWRTDGTPAGTRRWNDVPLSRTFFGFTDANVTELSGKLLFSAANDGRSRPWVSD